MLVLNDTVIREALISRLASSSNPPQKILEELHVHNSNAIADVVAINSHAHCYEIKGQTDKIMRISKQGTFYDLVFPKVTLVTTNNHIELAKIHAPYHWGIMIATQFKGLVKFKYVRGAKANPLVDPRSALLTLWKNELIAVAKKSEEDRLMKLSRADLISLIVSLKAKNDILNSIAIQLISRESMPGNLAPYKLCVNL